MKFPSILSERKHKLMGIDPQPKHLKMLALSRSLDSIKVTNLIITPIEISAEKTNAKTLTANPFINMRFARNADKNLASRLAPAFTLCCGLAKRGIKND